jgi:hypothetical protein
MGRVHESRRQTPSVPERPAIRDGTAQTHSRPPFDRLDIILGLALLALATLLALNAHDKLLHPLIDIGRDLYIPERIAEGEMLYGEISYYYPPLAPYLLAIVAALTDWSLRTVATTGIVIALLTGIVMYLFSRACIGRAAAAAVTLLFISVNVTGLYGYGSNYVFPYSHGAILGMLFFLTGLSFLVRDLHESESARNWWIGFTMLLLAGWCKLELAAFGSLLLLTSVLASRVQGSANGAQIARRLLLAAAVAAALLAGAFVLFSGSEKHWLLDQVLAPILFEGAEARTFYSRVTGSFMWKMNLAAALQGALLFAIHLAAVTGLDRIRGMTERGPVTRAAATVILLAVLGGSLPFLADERFLFFRAWTILQPLVLSGVVIAVVRQTRARTGPDAATLQLLLVLVASMAVTSRIYLHISPRWYGFWMTLPLYLLIAHLLFRTFPRIGLYSGRSSLLWLPLIVLISANGVSDQITLLSEKSHPVVTTRGTFHDHDPYRAAILNDVIRYLEGSPVEDLVVMPEGLTINYFTRIPNPIWYHTFSPMEIGDPEIEADVISTLDARPVRWVLISNLAYTEWGGEGFGRGYAVRLDRYLRERYELRREWRSPTFRFYLLERRPEAGMQSSVLAAE